MFVGISLSVLNDENLQGREKPILTIFSSMKCFEHNITYCELKNESTINDLTHVNNFIAASCHLSTDLTDIGIQRGI